MGRAAYCEIMAVSATWFFVLFSWMESDDRWRRVCRSSLLIDSSQL